MALGASRAAVLRNVIGGGMKLTLYGLTAGLAASLAATRLIAKLLYGVSPTDPLTFAGVALLLCFVSLAANFAPARRAAGVDPMSALRQE